MATFDCPHCGYSNPAASRFCVHCGTNLARRQPAAGGTAGARDQGRGARLTPNPLPLSPKEEDTTEDSSKEDSGPDVARPGPLLGDLGGLLEPADPLSFITPGSDELDPTRDHPTALSGELATDEEERKRLRRLFSEDLPLTVGTAGARGEGRGARLTPNPLPLSPEEKGNGLQRRFWVLVLLLGMTGALLWGAQSPPGGAGPHALPGLEQAHRQIDSLQPNSLVFVNWAYDPATAGEMDLVAQPLIEHLLQKQSKLIVFSQLPGGPATARRVIARAEESLQRPSRMQITANLVIEAGYLPGGAASLPLLGVAPARALPVDPTWVDLRERFSIAGLGDTGPALTLVIAARAEDVRRWLEQVQPLNGGTVVAATSAVAGPAVRPYLHSGQLAGLVSGWDGGGAYVRRSERARSVTEQARSLRHISGQNWGVGILIVTIILGNLAGLTERRLP